MTAAGVPSPSPDGPIAHTTLANGVRVVSEPVAAARSISVGVWLGVGSRDEPDEVAGLCHLLEHLIFKGTERRDARSLALAFDAVGGEMNAYTTKERTAYYARVPAGQEAVGIDLLLESVVEPALRAEDLASERAVVLEELAAADDDPSDLVDTRLFEAYFPAHALGREVIGRAETVATVSGEQIRAFQQRFFRGDNLVVAAAGAIDHGRVVDAAHRWLGDLPAGGAPVRTLPTAPPGRPAHVRRGTEQTHLALAWPAVGLHDEDRYAFTLLEHVLGDGPASRLFQEVRERRGLAYSVGSSLVEHTDVGVLTAYVGTAPDRLGEVLDVIADEVAALARDGVTEEELAAAKGYVTGTTLLGLEEPSTCMSRLGYLAVTYGKVEPVETYLARVESVTVEQVAAVARRSLDAPPVIASVGPRSPRRRRR